MGLNRDGTNQSPVYNEGGRLIPILCESISDLSIGRKANKVNRGLGEQLG